MFGRRKKPAAKPEKYPLDPYTGLPRLTEGRVWRVERVAWRSPWIANTIRVELLDRQGKCLASKSYSEKPSEWYWQYRPERLPEYCARILRDYNEEQARAAAVNKTLGTYPPNRFEGSA